jgi:hypothetical protein
MKAPLTFCPGAVALIFALVTVMTSAAFSATAGKVAEFSVGAVSDDTAKISGDSEVFALPELLSQAPKLRVEMKSIEAINVLVKKPIRDSR